MPIDSTRNDLRKRAIAAFLLLILLLIVSVGTHNPNQNEVQITQRTQQAQRTVSNTTTAPSRPKFVSSTTERKVLEHEGNKQGIVDCFASAQLTRWLFVGNSHSRNIFEMFASLLNERAIDGMALVDGFYIPPSVVDQPVRKVDSLKKDSAASYARSLSPPVQLAFASSNMLEHKFNYFLKTPPPTWRPFEVLFAGRFMWDMDAHNTWPHDFFFGLVERFSDLRKMYHAKDQRGNPVPSVKKILLHMPHDVKHIAKDEGFLSQQLQCRIPARLRMYRRLSRCAAHYVNTKVKDSVAPKVELFDVFEYSTTLPDDMVWGGGHHYEPPALQAMLGQLLDRHVCPGRNVAGASGVNNADALPFDKDPWANVEEDCREIFEAAEQDASKLHYGPIGAGVYEGQRFPPPDKPTQDNMHLYRNFTPVNKATGEFLLNGFRIRPRGMRPIDQVFQNVFDRRAQSCACSSAKGKKYDGCQLEWNIKLGKESIVHYCESKVAWDAGTLQEMLPTYMNFTAMNHGHWEELLSLLSVTPKKFKHRAHARVQMCLFNLGARAEDVLDEEYLSRLRPKIHSDEWQFVCQCSGVFAPHLIKNEMETINATNLQYRRDAFCNKTWPLLRQPNLFSRYQSCAAVFSRLKQ